MKTAEEILKKYYLNDKWEPTFKQLIQPMEEYAIQFQSQQREELRSELIKYEIFNGETLAHAEAWVDDYLTNNPSNGK